MDLLALLVIVVFFILVRPVNEIKDVAHHGGYLYVAVGRQGVRVLDVRTKPESPVEVGAYNTFGTASALDIASNGEETILYVADGKSGISAFKVSPDGRLSHQWNEKSISPAQDIAVRGKFALVALGKKGLAITQVDSAAASGGKRETWGIQGIGTAVQVEIHGNTAYIIDQAWNLHLVNFDQPRDPVLIKSIPISVKVNDLYIYGSTGYIATEGNGLILVDFNAPPEGAIIGQFPDLMNVRSVSVYGAFAYISTGTGGIHAIEISNPREIVRVGEITKIRVGQVKPVQPADVDGETPSGDPVEARIDAGKLLQVGETLYFSDGLRGLRSVKPEQVLKIENPDTFGAIGVEQGWVEDVVIVKEKSDKADADKKTYAYLAGADRGLWIIDVTKKEAPEDIPYLDSVEGDLSNRVYGYANAVAAYGEYVYVAYKTKGVRIFQVSDPKNPMAINQIGLDGETHDLAIYDDKTLFVAAGSNGLRIINVEQKTSTSVIGSEDTPGNTVGVFVTDNHAYVADSGNGLQIINVLDLQKPTLIASQDTDGEARAVTVYKFRKNQDSPVRLYAYVADGSGGIAIFEVSNPQEPRRIDPIETQEFAQDVFIKGDKLYVAERNQGLIVYDLSDPEKPTRRGTHDTPGAAAGLFVEGDYAYIADHNRGLRVINIANPDDLREYGFFDMPTRVKDLVIVANSYAYLVDGAAGMWTVSLGNVRNPIPANFLDTPGVPKGIELGDDGKIYIADGNKGLQVVEISQNPIDPTIVGSYKKLTDVRGVKVRGGYAYVANGGGGMPVLSIFDSQNITQTGFFGTHGYALDIDIAWGYAYVVSTDGKIDIASLGSSGNLPEVKPVPPMNTLLGDTQNVRVVPYLEHAFVSDGSRGLVVFDVSQPYKPVKIFDWDTPGKLMDVAVKNHYAFLADGKGGIGVLYMPEPTVFQTHPDWYATFEPVSGTKAGQNCEADALAIDVIPHVVREVRKPDGEKQKSLFYYVYVATDQCGLMTLEYSVSVAFNEGGLYATPGDATFGMVARGYGGVLEQTLKGIWQKKGEGGISLLQIPATGRLIAKNQLMALDPRIKDTAWLFVFGIFLFTLGIFFWLAMISYFVLPVREPKEGWQSFQRLCLFFRGMHGQLVAARNGVGRTADLEPRRPGVALVDLNSAVVIEEYPAGGVAQRKLLAKRKETGESLYKARAEGPGVVFLESYERVRGVADLRQQVRARMQVEAQTRDGIEISSTVFTGFTLGELPEVVWVTIDGEEKAESIRVVQIEETWIPIPGRGGKERRLDVVGELLDDLDLEDKKEIFRTLRRHGLTQVDADLAAEMADRSQRGPYLFDESRVFDAIVSKPYDVDNKEIKEWTELPAHVAAGLFRNLINQEFYDHLFQPTDPKEYPLKDFKQVFSKLMRNQGVLAYQYVRNRDGSNIRIGQAWNRRDLQFAPERELHTPKPLRARGLKVLFAGFSELKPTHQDVSHYLTRYWQSEWQKEATIMKSELDLEAMRARNLGIKEAETDLVNTLSMIMGESSYTREALAYRVMQALEQAAADPGTHSLLPGDTIQMLGRIHELLLPEENPSDGKSPPGEPVDGEEAE